MQSNDHELPAIIRKKNEIVHTRDFYGYKKNCVFRLVPAPELVPAGSMSACKKHSVTPG